MIAARRFTTPDGAVTGVRLAEPAGSSAQSGIVFVHGVGSTAAIWDAQLDAFGNDYRCAAVELRGNGTYADPDPSLITREGFATDVVTVLDALNLSQCTLVGCSLGGVIAFELWKRAEPRIAGMAICDSFARYPDGAAYAKKVEQIVSEAGSMRLFAQRRAAQLNLPPQRYAETVAQMACKSVPSYLAATQATWTGDYWPILSSITVPVLVAYGEHDAVAPRELSEEIAAGIPSSELEEIPAAGHVANADNPAAFNALLRDFLQRNGLGR